jgi:uncharacterized protein YjbI with pentapeptide repeats
MRRWNVLVVAALLSAVPVGAEAASPAPSALPEPSAAPVSSPAADASAVPSPAASPVAVDLPAGVQYLGTVATWPWGLPASSEWSLRPSSFVTKGDQVVATLGRRGKQIRAAVRTGDGGWEDVLVDAGRGVRPPAPYRLVENVYATSLSAGPHGFLVTGAEDAWTQGHLSTTRIPFAWFSPDARHWMRVDLRAAVGSAGSFVAEAGIATPTGWRIAGASTSRDLRAKAGIVTLASDDGLHWRVVSRLAGPWALTASSLDRLGDTLVLTGTEWVCDVSGSMLNAGIGNQVLRFWTTADGGATWKPADGTAGGVAAPRTPAPRSVKGCTGGIGTYSSTGSSLGVVDGRSLVVIGNDHVRVATTGDLRTWRTAALPGGSPVGGIAYVPDAPHTTVATPDGDGLAILALGPLRDAQDGEAPFGAGVVAWQSIDAGTSWTRVPATVPLQAGSNSALVPSPDGSVWLEARNEKTGRCGNIGCTLRLGPWTARQSVAGPLQPPPPCVPGPRATCAFSTLDGSHPAADLARIDLYGGTIAGTADLTGATLADGQLSGVRIAAGAALGGADLRRAKLPYATIEADVQLAGASLKGADLTNARILTSDLAGADWTGANLTRADLAAADLTGVVLKGVKLDSTRVSQTILGADLRGTGIDGAIVEVGPMGQGLAGHDFGRMNLEGTYFSGGWSEATRGDLTHADFSHAKVDNMGFSNVDLTGARFPRGVRSQIDFSPGVAISFGDGVICPDGKPGTKKSFSYDCRLGR